MTYINGATMRGEDQFGDRFKSYEDCFRTYLPNRIPVVIRLDGKAFHTWTKGLSRPYCQSLMDVMNEVAQYLCENVENCVMAYTQSDEISLLLVNFKNTKITPWFDNNVIKMVSVSASLASAKLTSLSPNLFGAMRLGHFDSRAFVVPQSDVENYFIWRQGDWVRNSIQMLAQSLYSHDLLHGKSLSELHNMCFAKGYNWADLNSHIKNGRIVLKRQVEKATQHTDGRTIMRSEWYIPDDTPIFLDTRDLFRELMKPDEKIGT